MRKVSVTRKLSVTRKTSATRKVSATRKLNAAQRTNAARKPSAMRKTSAAQRTNVVQRISAAQTEPSSVTAAEDKADIDSQGSASEADRGHMGSVPQASARRKAIDSRSTAPRVDSSPKAVMAGIGAGRTAGGVSMPTAENVRAQGTAGTAGTIGTMGEPVRRSG